MKQRIFRALNGICFLAQVACLTWLLGTLAQEWIAIQECAATYPYSSLVGACDMIARMIRAAFPAAPLLLAAFTLQHAIEAAASLWPRGSTKA